MLTGGCESPLGTPAPIFAPRKAAHWALFINSCPCSEHGGEEGIFQLLSAAPWRLGRASPCLGHGELWRQKGMLRRSWTCGHAGGTLSPARGRASAPVLPLQLWEPERAAEGGGPRSAPQLSPPSPTSSVGIGGESALQSAMGAARGGNSPGCGGRMELGSPAAAPGERKRCGVAWSLPVVLHPAPPPCQVPQLPLRTGRRCAPEPPLTVVRCQQGCCERIQEGQPASPGCGTPSAEGEGGGPRPPSCALGWTPGPLPSPVILTPLPSLGPALVPCSVHLPASSTRQEITSLRSRGRGARAGPWGAAPRGPGARPLPFLTVN